MKKLMLISTTLNNYILPITMHYNPITKPRKTAETFLKGFFKAPTGANAIYQIFSLVFSLFSTKSSTSIYFQRNTKNDKEIEWTNVDKCD